MVLHEQSNKIKMVNKRLNKLFHRFNKLRINLFPLCFELLYADSGVLCLHLSRFMGSRSHPRFVLCVCVCVCVSRCLWVCVIEADSLQLRVITVGYIRSCHAVSLVRSLQCLPCSGWRFGPFLFPGSAIPEPCCFPGLRTPTRLPIASLRYPPLPTESSTVVFSHCLFL